MRYRIKALHYKNKTRYFPQWRFLFFWFNFDHDYNFGDYEFSSEVRAQEFLDDFIDKTNPVKEYIHYGKNN